MASLDLEELVDHSSHSINRRFVIFADHVHWTVHAHLTLGLREFELGSCWTRGDDVRPFSNSQRLGRISEAGLVV